MGLTASALKFYRPGTTKLLSGTETIDAQLDSNGLTLSKGGIKVIPSGGAIGDNNSVYISSDNLGSKVASLVNDNNKTNWRAVIGSKFGVDSEGNLYASDVNIQGTIEAKQGSVFGDKSGMHISIGESEIGFWRGPEDNDIHKTAYITGQYMYIPYTVVLNEMQVGTKPNYKEVEDYPSGSNPSEQGWYEIVNEEYVLTTDTTIVSGKTYYEIDGNTPLWSWRKMDSENLRLMWLGGEV